MAEMEWTSDTSIRLMQEYKKRPELWDTTHDLYRAQTAKYEAWSELGQMFECDIADLRKKLNSIFASHRREKAKIRAGGRSTWFLYNYMSFLPSHVDNNVATVEVSLHDVQESAESSDSDDSEGAQQTVTVKQEPGVPVRRTRQTITAPPVPRQRIMRPLLKRKLVNKEAPKETSSQLDSRLLETLRLLRKSDLSKKKDECDTFGEYIAMSLRKHDERSQSMIKQAINNILFEQEMKKYNSNLYTVILSEPAENPLVLADTGK